MHTPAKLTVRLSGSSPMYRATSSKRRQKLCHARQNNTHQAPCPLLSEREGATTEKGGPLFIFPLPHFQCCGLRLEM